MIRSIHTDFDGSVMSLSTIVCPSDVFKMKTRRAYISKQNTVDKLTSRRD